MPRRPFEPPAADDEEERRLFLEAMARLERVPDKDGGGGGTSAVRRHRRRRRRRDVTVDARLDLHGLTTEEARHRLAGFIVQAHKSGHRRVLVITGKGRGSPGGRSVLRDAVGRWLRRDGRRAGVHRVATAPRRLGGSGAWLVDLAEDLP